MTFEAPSPPPPPAPSPEDIMAQQRAQNERVASTQDTLQRETSRLFRLYGGASSLPGMGRASGLSKRA
jgi:hypothetical protein